MQMKGLNAVSPRSRDTPDLQVRVKCAIRLSSARPVRPIRGPGRSRTVPQVHLHPSGFRENDVNRKLELDHSMIFF